MYGWRGKFGFVTPSLSDTVLMEFNKVLPDGVLVTTVDLKVQNLVDSEFEKAVANIEEAVKILNYEEVQAIIVGGTPPITRLGFDADKEIIQNVEKLTGKPASTTPTAEVDALRALGMKKIALISPYVEDLNSHLTAFLKHCGFEVAIASGLGIVKNVELTRVPFDTAYMRAKEAFFKIKGSIDGIFLTCPRWPTVRCIEALECDLGVPVVTSAQALVWKALKLLRINKVNPGFGKLFAGFDNS